MRWLAPLLVLGLVASARPRPSPSPSHHHEVVAPDGLPAHVGPRRDAVPERTAPPCVIATGGPVLAPRVIAPAPGYRAPRTGPAAALPRVPVARGPPRPAARVSSSS